MVNKQEQFNLDIGRLRGSEGAKVGGQSWRNRLGPDHGGLINSRRRIWTSLGPVKVVADFEQRRAMVRVVAQGP